MRAEDRSRTIPDIVGDLLSQFTSLVSKESELARTEMAENVSRAGMGIGLILGGAVLLIPALVILLGAATVWLQNAYALSPAQAALITGGIAFIIGALLVLIGANQIRPKNLVPNKTLAQVRQDAAVARQQMRQSNDVLRAA